MAASFSMQSLFTSPATGVLNRTGSVHSLPSMYVQPRLRRNTAVTSCVVEDGQNDQPTPPARSNKFADVFAFSGPAQERINGRLAMTGFVAAMAVELSSGRDVFAQISNGGVPLFIGTSVVLTLASLIPLLKGVSVQSKPNAVMTSDAELLNGRLAMLGLVALAFTEFVKGGALV